MSIPTDSNRGLLTVIANARAKAGKEDALRAALEALIEPTSKEDGYVTYALHQGADDPAVFYFYENWDSAAHLEAHLATAHIASFLAVMEDLLDGPLVIQQLKRVA